MCMMMLSVIIPVCKWMLPHCKAVVYGLITVLILRLNLALNLLSLPESEMTWFSGPFSIDGCTACFYKSCFMRITGNWDNPCVLFALSLSMSRPASVYSPATMRRTWGVKCNHVHQLLSKQSQAVWCKAALRKTSAAEKTFNWLHGCEVVFQGFVPGVSTVCDSWQAH